MLHYTTRTVITDSVEMCVHKKGTNVYAPNAIVRHSDDAEDDYEELPMSEYQKSLISEKMKAERISQLIHERYSLDDELALAANVNLPASVSEEQCAKFAQEYADYQAYRAEVKAKVKAEIENGTFPMWEDDNAFPSE